MSGVSFATGFSPFIFQVLGTHPAVFRAHWFSVHGEYSWSGHRRPFVVLGMAPTYAAFKARTLPVFPPTPSFPPPPH